MKMKRTAAVVLAALLVLAGGGALAEVADTMTTEINVTFVEAIYFYDFPEGGGMDIDFGEQPLPALGVNTLIPNPDGAHTLRVCDRRSTAGGWSVSAEYTAYLSGDGETLLSALYLFDPACSDGLTPNLTGPVSSPPYPPDLKYVAFNINGSKLADAGSGLTPGNYDLTCAPGNVRLYISGNIAKNAKAQAYATTVTWTLTLEPEPDP